MKQILSNRLRNTILVLLPALAFLGCPAGTARSGTGTSSSSMAKISGTDSVSPAPNPANPASAVPATPTGSHSPDPADKSPGPADPAPASSPTPDASGTPGNPAKSTTPGATASRTPDQATASTTPAAGTPDPAPDSTITVRAGQPFNIRLRCAAGQGYSWLLTDSSFKNIRQTHPQTFEPLADSKPGSDGIQIFHFVAARTGTETISYIYVQPFMKPYPSNAPRKVFLINIQ